MKKTLNPTWNESFDVENVSHEDLDVSSIRFKIMDWDALTSDDPLGYVLLDARKIKNILYGSQKFVEEVIDGRGRLSGQLLSLDLNVKPIIVNTDSQGFEIPKKKPVVVAEPVKPTEEFEMPKRKDKKPVVDQPKVVEEVFEMPKKRTKPVDDLTKKLEQTTVTNPEPEKKVFSQESRFKSVNKPKITPQVSTHQTRMEPLEQTKSILEEKVVTKEEGRILKKQFLSSKFNMGKLEGSGHSNDDEDELNEFIESQGVKISSKAFTTSEENISALFQKFDEAGYGTLDSVSIRALLLHLGFPMYKKYIDVIVHLMDEDGSDAIDFDEFTAWWKLMAHGGKFETLVEKTEILYKMWDLFSSADDDQSGFLEFEECKILFPVLIDELRLRQNEFKDKQVSHEDVLRMMHEIDENGDGRVSFPELVKLMKLYD